MTVSPDGKNVYIAAEDTTEGSSKSDAVTTFSRGSDGKLKQIGCVSEGVLPMCVQGAALGGAVGVAASDGGKSVYVAAGGVSGPGDSDAVVALARSGSDGTLTWIGCVSEGGAFKCSPGTGLRGASGIDVSPDGLTVYVASLSSGAVVALNRKSDGSITQLQCVADGGVRGCDAAKSLAGAADVAVTPDGTEVYATARLASSVTGFSRAADGKLGLLDCASEDGSGGTCSNAEALDGANGLAISTAGAAAMYVSALVLKRFGEDGAVAVFERPQPATGGGGPPYDDGGSGAGGGSGEPDEPPPLAPPSGGDGGIATGGARAPDLSGTLGATCAGAGLDVTLRIRIRRPAWAGPFAVRISVPSRGVAKTVRVRPHGRTSVSLRTFLPGACGAPRVVARLDAGDRVRESNERNNVVWARPA